MWVLTVKNFKETSWMSFDFLAVVLSIRLSKTAETYTADTGFSITSIAMSVTLTRYTNKVSLWVCLPKASIRANLQNKLLKLMKPQF